MDTVKQYLIMEITKKDLKTCEYHPYIDPNILIDEQELEKRIDRIFRLDNWTDWGKQKAKQILFERK